MAIVQNVKNSAVMKPASGKSARVITNGEDVYKVVGSLGKGAYGVVDEVEFKGERYAIKQQQSYDYGASLSIPTLVEADIMSRMIHPHIVSSKDIFFDQGNTTLINYVMSREDRQLRGTPLQSVPELKRILFQLISTVAFLHSEYIIHADLKPENILLTKNESGKFQIRLADFGLSQYDLPQAKAIEVQTYWYRAPEICGRSRFYGTEIDIWSLGLIMREMITGVPLSTAPESKHLKDVLQKLNIDYDLSKLSEKELSTRTGHSGTRSSMLNSLTIPARIKILIETGATPSIRSSIDRTVGGPKKIIELGKDWPEYERLMNQCFTLDPYKRISAADMLKSPFFAGFEPIQGEVYYEAESMPPTSDTKIYKLLESIVGENVFYNKSTLILATDLYDRVHRKIEWHDPEELALGCLDIALKINQRCSLPIKLFILRLNNKQYKPLNAWYLETQIAQTLHFRLYLENVAVWCQGRPLDTIYQVYQKAHMAGENTRDFDKLCGLILSSPSKKDESNASA
jgi:serine/threonine protein kinase